MQVYPELKLLGFAVIIGLVQLAWAAIAAQPQRGRAWNVGPRDEPCPLTGMAGRLGGCLLARRGRGKLGRRDRGGAQGRRRRRLFGAQRSARHRADEGLRGEIRNQGRPVHRPHDRLGRGRASLAYSRLQE